MSVLSRVSTVCVATLCVILKEVCLHYISLSLLGNINLIKETLTKCFAVVYWAKINF